MWRKVNHRRSILDIDRCFLFCVENEDAPKKKKKNKKNKKDQSKKLSKGNEEIENEVSYSDQLENKLKWAVDEVKTSFIANISHPSFLFFS